MFITGYTGSGGLGLGGDVVWMDDDDNVHVHGGGGLCVVGVGVELDEDAVPADEALDDGSDLALAQQEQLLGVDLGLDLLEVPGGEGGLGEPEGEGGDVGAGSLGSSLVATQVVDEQVADAQIVLVAELEAVDGGCVRGEGGAVRAGVGEVDGVRFETDDAGLEEARGLADVAGLDEGVEMEARKGLGQTDHGLELADGDAVAGAAAGHV